MESKDSPAQAGCGQEPAGLDDAGLDLCSDALGYALRRAQVRSYELLFGILGAEALTPARITALSLIATHPGMNQSALAEHLKVNRASVVKVIDTLESHGLVQRCPVQGDRRSRALAVTGAGREELRSLRRKMDIYERALAERLDAGERQQLMRLLEKVAAPASP
ncbi:MarR family winged helix-turn-helix transcriptional regulator [Kerstersia similis]|uniref:MarR family winged helix-turn-helix transcriptional regulator n=1 Tax=Kerstersia similis TaxID=206505 RepID=UPI0039EEB975